MGNEIANNTNNYYSSLVNSGLSPSQLLRLDALSSKKDDKIIDKDVFTIANSVINRVELKESDVSNPALIQEVLDIMNGNIDLSQISNEYNATPMSGISPDTLMQGLHLSQRQVDELLDLSTEMTGNENTIDRGIASAVICIVRRQPAPNGIPEEMNSKIQNILGGQQENNGHFGL